MVAPRRGLCVWGGGGVRPPNPPAMYEGAFIPLKLPLNSPHPTPHHPAIYEGASPPQTPPHHMLLERPSGKERY